MCHLELKKKNQSAYVEIALVGESRDGGRRDKIVRQFGQSSTEEWFQWRPTKFLLTTCVISAVAPVLIVIYYDTLLFCSRLPEGI